MKGLKGVCPKRRAERDERLDKVLPLWNMGLTAKVIGERLGMTRGAVLGIISRGRDRGIEIKGRTTTELLPRKPRPSRTRRPPDRVVKPLKENKVSFPKRVAKTTRCIEIQELTAHTCRWPLWGETEKRLYCGAWCDRVDPYCKYHTGLSKG